MNSPPVFGDVLLIIGTILALLPCSLLSSRYQFERWAKIAFIILGLAGVGWGILGFVDRSIGSRDRWHPLVSHMHSLCAGVVIGVVLVLVLSGEFPAARRRRKEAA